MSGDRLRSEFVDTNILIYAFDATAGEKRRVAVELVLARGEDRKSAGQHQNEEEKKASEQNLR